MMKLWNFGNSNGNVKEMLKMAFGEKLFGNTVLKQQEFKTIQFTYNRDVT